MPGRSGRLLSTILILLVIFLVSVEHSSAQDAFTARLSAPDTSSFPHLTAYLDVHDPTGAFIHGLSLPDILLQENNLQIPASELQEQKLGVQFVVAITPGDSFTIRDSMGVSRYEYLLQGILAGAWKDQPSAEDDFSLLTLGGPQLIHSSDPAALRTALELYQPSDTNTAPSLEVLASALQVAAETTIRPAMERAILFITPPQASEVALGLQSIITTAIQQNIHIYVWLVAASENFELPEIDLLRNLASQTQATFFAFSHDEPVPDVESILEPLRYIYQLGYDSGVTNPGTQQVAVQVQAGSELITSEPVSFEVDLQLPSITFLAPPAEIMRNFSARPTEGVANGNSDLEPSEQVLNIKVTFPDGHARPLTITRLYVDGLLVGENTSPPFDRFVWDLRPYSQSGSHTLSVEVVDSLGLVGKSGESSIKISLPTTTQGVLLVLSQKRALIIGATALISIAILVLVLILGGRIRPKPYPGQVIHPASSGEKTKPGKHLGLERQRSHLSTQSTKITSPPPAQASSRPKSWFARLPWFKQKEGPVPALAQLIPLLGPDEVTLPAPLQIIADNITLGSDPHQASLVIADPSIEALHASIRRDGKSFWISDAGSVAGTWVNFNAVNTEGIRLEHADIIHLGQVGFRFYLAEPDHLRKVVVTPLEPKR